MKKNYFVKLNSYWLFLILLLLFKQKTIAQCAGTDNTVTICDKELDTTLQNFSLFDNLNGTPETGGTWSADSRRNQSALNSDDTLNLWSINQFGSHSFTYTNGNCNETATITINLGGYPGEDNTEGGANACSDNNAVNLFAFLDNELLNLNTDINGTWTGVGTANTYLNDNIFRAEDSGPGTYNLIYTVNNSTSPDYINTCSSDFARVTLEVHLAPESGEGSNLIICDTEDFSIYTDFDLYSLISGEDDFGIWEELNGTSQISDENDSIINIQEIFNNYGNGDYSFSYTVFPETHPICDPSTTIVTISIPRLFGAFSMNTFCGNQLNSISLIYDNSTRLSFDHNLTYQIKNNNTNDVIFNGTTNIFIEPEEDEEDGITTDIFYFDVNIPIPTPGNYTISTVSTSNINGLSCSSLTISESTFNVYNPEVSVSEICFKKDDIVELNISNYTNNNGFLVNETQNLDYSITHNGVSQTITNTNITFTNGNAIIPVDLSLFTNSVDGDINVIFNNVNNTALECINFTFPVQFPPSEIELDLIVDNECNATEILVSVIAPTLPNGEYAITYEVTEIGNPALLIDDTINIVGGTANLELDVSNLDEGDYEVVLRSIQNDTHPCRTQFEFEMTENFIIGGAPETPVLEPSQTFCFSDNLPNGPTLTDIMVESDEVLNWFADATSITPLPIDTLLVDGEDYYVIAGDLNNSCNDLERVVVVTTVNKIEPLTIDNPNLIFCDKDNATLSDISITTNNGGELIWYDSLTGNNILNETTLLTNTSYYVVEKVDDCESTERLQINVSINLPPTPLFEGETALCPLLTPTILNLEEKEVDNEIIKLIKFDDALYELIWYDSEEDGTELSSSEPLEENINYYAVLREKETGCEGERLAISMTFTTCDPEEYNFFIPDGFSPNNDGVNDTYFIPNVEYFYPDYYFEIFNRYGQSLFKGDLSNPAWDGTYNGSTTDTTSGVYFYIINYNKDNLKPSQGRLYLSK